MQTTLNPLSGATRVYLIVGDPIAQVKAPAGVSLALQQRGVDGVVIPYQVSAADFDDCMHGSLKAKNVDGVIVTIPHKFVAATLCSSLSDRAAFLGATNTLRRKADGSMHGDIFDGLGMVQAIARKGGVLKASKVLLVGAGGAGSAIAHAVCEAGAAQLSIVDADAVRRDGLVQRLNTLKTTQVVAGVAGAAGVVAANIPSPAGFDIVINATPMGMRPGDPLPFDAKQLLPSTFVADVITMPYVVPHVALAQGIGCKTVTGVDMFVCVRDLMVEFFV